MSKTYYITVSLHPHEVDEELMNAIFQTWFGATLIYRFDESNQEVTINRPNVSTLLQSSALIRM